MASEEVKGDRDVDSEAIQIKNLSRNVGESHLRAIFGCYGEISKINIPVYFKCKCFFQSNQFDQYIMLHIKLVKVEGLQLSSSLKHLPLRRQSLIWMEEV
jgi:hypothetical protein